MPRTKKGEIRKVGVEIEFSGLDVQVAAECLAQHLGGRIRKIAPHHFIIEDTPFGAVQLELDTRLVKPTETDSPAWQRFDWQMKQVLGDAASVLVPVEMIAPPVPYTDLHHIARISDILRLAGATGTGHSVIYAFGTHLNVEVVSLSIEHLYPTLRAYALIEDWLRQVHQIDTSRRITTFIDPFPQAYRTWLANHPATPDTAEFISSYLAHNPTRNRGLDMTPILLSLDQANVLAALGDGKANARPTFHYRLPNSNVDRLDWTLADDWATWVRVEEVAADTDLLETLAKAWLAEVAASKLPVGLLWSNWLDTIEKILASRGMGMRTLGVAPP